jgi:hypothetical protein
MAPCKAASTVERMTTPLGWVGVVRIKSTVAGGEGRGYEGISGVKCAMSEGGVGDKSRPVALGFCLHS